MKIGEQCITTLVPCLSVARFEDAPSIANTRNNLLNGGYFSVRVGGVRQVAKAMRGTGAQRGEIQCAETVDFSINANKSFKRNTTTISRNERHVSEDAPVRAYCLFM